MLSHNLIPLFEFELIRCGGSDDSNLGFLVEWWKKNWLKKRVEAGNWSYFLFFSTTVLFSNARGVQQSADNRVTKNFALGGIRTGSVGVTSELTESVDHGDNKTKWSVFPKVRKFDWKINKILFTLTRSEKFSNKSEIFSPRTLSSNVAIYRADSISDRCISFFGLK